MPYVDFLKHFSGLSVSISAILVAVVAFLFSAKNSVTGTDQASIKKTYANAIRVILIILLASVVCSIYFCGALLGLGSSATYDKWDTIFAILMLCLIPSVLVMWAVLLWRHSE